jgi:hypothetical protein
LFRELHMAVLKVVVVVSMPETEGCVSLSLSFSRLIHMNAIFQSR